jgi:FemAB-related protein (PEP-CTERM system-associated)
MAVPNLYVSTTEAVAVPVQSLPLTVRAFETGDDARWDEFVSARANGTFFQLSGWKRVIEKTFGFESCYFYTERGGRITAIAPLFRISNWVLGRCLLSVPFGVYAGICAEEEESRQRLLKHVMDLAHSEQVDYLELRNRKEESLPGFHPNTLYVTFTTALSPDAEANLKRLPKDTRYMIRKAQKGGLRAQHGWDQLKDFLPLFYENLQRHGTPPFPEALFHHLAEEFPQHLDLMMVYSEARPVCGVVSFFFRDTILPYYAGASEDAQRLAGNNLMYWELMRYATQKGIRYFDFGRSKRGTGSYAFKTQWNMTEEPLHYGVHLVRRKTVPNFSPVNPKFERATRVWQKLPTWLTRAIGPHVVRWFP